MKSVSLSRTSATRTVAFASLLVMAVAAHKNASADPVLLNTDPFAGSTALTTPGRQIFAGQERTLPGFSTQNDSFVFDLKAFSAYGVTSLSFLNAPSSGIPSSGFNVIVLQDFDNDNNPATPFAAGTAANVIANRIDTDGAGFFIYKNSALDVNRLVFSTNLNSASADLSILARIASPTGQAAIDELPRFTADNFVATVPEPSSLALIGAGLTGVAAIRRRKKA
ncbi:PEP-CTERM sorting domain-containing protein [Roseateles puraquae]|uniref:Ice-binding protein C-terminal domain-containing protein n=1 Tax=Roseateles puraquae TaxID=431059 RepID=A0A254N539_9BURK|nr:PEP-CTERM sorting domain-containing protein [Roseateles puraquae]MDG0854328.1 PEP-CTERM sorting domain-containing protein [Roseateles puraquae]OWR00735.1 hypothetical protein CDO81_23640 [Roseateles puraquae]